MFKKLAVLGVIIGIVALLSCAASVNDAALRDRPEQSEPTATRESLLLVVFIHDSAITIGVKGGFMPSLFFHAFDDTEQSIFDELAARLNNVRERYGQGVSDPDNIMIAPADGTAHAIIEKVIDAARIAGYTNVTMMKLIDNEDLGAGIVPLTRRSKTSIQAIAEQNMASLRSAYNKHLLKNPNAGGKITVKFAIGEDGIVISAEIIESTMDEPEFEQFVVEQVKSWDFGILNSSGITEITYPFVFTP